MCSAQTAIYRNLPSIYLSIHPSIHPHTHPSLPQPVSQPVNPAHRHRSHHTHHTTSSHPPLSLAEMCTAALLIMLIDLSIPR
mmetsp:Transcript_50981/g.127839  ORF Transcript_50981/g.127839 Transcript_50981/m.127839 type:complete len:82 (-) Transcript_50981:514-759(-)